ncbi:MAG: type II secretion system F family protein [Dehalococcoidia bacterium]|nr:type II secretion system F family protein [Dehalococcoidia bacterium]
MKTLMQYQYVAYRAGGAVVTGTLEADSEQRAEELLWQSDMTVLSLKKKKTYPSVRQIFPTIFGVKRDDVINFSRDLSTLLGSGIGILPAITMLYERTSKASMKKLVRDLLVSVETGSSYSEACAKHPAVFSPFYIRLARVCEEIGNLEQMLRQITVQMSKEAAIMSKVRGAMAYPAFVLVIAILAVVVLMTFVVPAIEGLFVEVGGGQLPIVTRIIVAVGDFFSANIIWIIVGVIVVIGGVMWYLKTPHGKRTKDSLVLKIPMIKDVIIRGTMSRMARNLATLIGGGITLREALDLVIETTDNHTFKEALSNVRSDVHSGQLFSKAMMDYPIFPPMLTQVVAVGEQSGRLEANLETVADFYESETDKAISRATGMLAPALVIVVGGIVALIAISMISPIYNLAGQIGGR